MARTGPHLHDPRSHERSSDSNSFSLTYTYDIHGAILSRNTLVASPEQSVLVCECCAIGQKLLSAFPRASSPSSGWFLRHHAGYRGCASTRPCRRPTRSSACPRVKNASASRHDHDAEVPASSQKQKAGVFHDHMAQSESTCCSTSLNKSQAISNALATGVLSISMRKVPCTIPTRNSELLQHIDI